MKKTITLILILLSFGYANAQAPAIQWQKCYGGTLDDYALSIQLTTDGGYILAGRSKSNDGDVTVNHGYWDYWIVKLGITGAIQWQKSFGGSFDDEAFAIKTTIDGGYILAGRSLSIDGDVTVNHGNTDYWIVKLDTTGTIQWQKSFGGSSLDEATNIIQTDDGGYAVIGYTNSINGDLLGLGLQGDNDYWILKLNATGTIQWQKTFGGNFNDNAKDIKQTSDGGFIITGYSESTNGNVSGNHGGFDYWIVKLDATGAIQWQKSLGGSGEDGASAIQTTTDGGYIVVGYSSSNNGNVTGNHGGDDYWIVKLDAIGTIQWQKSLGGSGSDSAVSVQTSLDGGYLVAGSSTSSDGNVIGNHGSNDNWLVKMDAIGNLQWQKSLGGSGSDVGYSIQQSSDGGYVVAGWTDSNNGDVTGNHGGVDYWIVKLAPDALATSVFDKKNIVIYPNPVCDVLQMQTPNNTTITKAKIIAINGQVVLEQTQNTNTINVENLAQGTYILEAYSGEGKYSSKFVKE